MLKLCDLRQELSICAYFVKVKSVFDDIRSSENLDAVHSIVCLGLGRFSSCSTALAQLAFLAVLKKYLSADDVQFYDPIFSEVEKQILVKLGYSVLHTNCEGKYVTEKLSLFYFPHCPKQLVNNFLWKNWNESNLENIILICNSFDKLIRNTPERFLKRDAEYVLRISNYVRKIHSPSCRERSQQLYSRPLLQINNRRCFRNHR